MRKIRRYDFHSSPFSFRQFDCPPVGSQRAKKGFHHLLATKEIVIMKKRIFHFSSHPENGYFNRVKVYPSSFCVLLCFGRKTKMTIMAGWCPVSKRSKPGLEEQNVHGRGLADGLRNVFPFFKGFNLADPCGLRNGCQCCATSFEIG